MTRCAPGTLVHATTVALQGQGVLLQGPSGAGKSDLALRLQEVGAVLVADDQTILTVTEQGLVAAPPPSIAGLIEVRGVGLVQVPYRCSAPVRLVVRLVPPDAVERLPDPQTVVLCGMTVPAIDLHAFEVSVVTKIRLALNNTLANHGDPSVMGWV